MGPSVIQLTFFFVDWFHTGPLVHFELGWFGENHTVICSWCSPHSPQLDGKQSMMKSVVFVLKR